MSSKEELSSITSQLMPDEAEWLNDAVKAHPLAKNETEYLTYLILNERLRQKNFERFEQEIKPLFTRWGLPDFIYTFLIGILELVVDPLRHKDL